MKLVFLIFLIGVSVFLGLSVSSLRKELLSAREHAAFLQERNGSLQKELVRMNRLCSEKEQFLNEIEQSITELGSKVPLETLKRHLPKKMWAEIKPIVDRLHAFREGREGSHLSGQR